VVGEVMLGCRWSALTILAALSSPVAAAEYLTEVTSQVYQVPGTPKEISTRAATCIAQNLRSGTVDAPQVINSDPDNGVIVAQNALRFGSFPEWKIRSRLTFEARDGRFRISQTGLEMFNDMAGGWGSIGKWTGSPWKKAEATFNAAADAVARCVMSAKQPDNW
jgi:hypothetical protein